MSFLSTKIGKAIIATSTLTGVGCLIANILSPSSFWRTSGSGRSSEAPSTSISSTSAVTSLETVIPSSPDGQAQTKLSTTFQSPESSVSALSSQKQDLLIRYKKCQVVLTSEDEKSYKVVACKDVLDENLKGPETLYLFNFNSKTLEKIDGLTTKNDMGWRPLESTNPSWKNKQWQAYKGKDNYRDWGKDLLSPLFTLKYVSQANPFRFPLFDYLSIFCGGNKWRKFTGLPFKNTQCARFDIPIVKLRKNRLMKQRLTQSFGPEKTQCFIGTQKVATKTLNWEEKDSCDTPQR